MMMKVLELMMVNGLYFLVMVTAGSNGGSPRHHLRNDETRAHTHKYTMGEGFTQRGICCSNAEKTHQIYR